MVPERGSATRKKKPKSLHPSMFAASSNSLGSVLSKNVRQTIRLYTETAPGSTMTHSES